MKDSSAQIIKNDQSPPPNFRNLVNLKNTVDDIGALSSIPPRVLTVEGVRSCYLCKVGEIGDFEIREAYENKIIVEEGLTRALGFPNVFKVEWIKIVLNCIHDMKIWLEGGPIKINKAIIHRVTWYPTLD